MQGNTFSKIPIYDDVFERFYAEMCRSYSDFCKRGVSEPFKETLKEMVFDVKPVPKFDAYGWNPLCTIPPQSITYRMILIRRVSASNETAVDSQSLGDVLRVGWVTKEGKFLVDVRYKDSYDIEDEMIEHPENWEYRLFRL